MTTASATCAECGGPITLRPGKVRRSYCGSRCRKRASRRLSRFEGAHLNGQPVTSAEKVAPVGSDSEDRTHLTIPQGESQDYGAESIKILDDAEALERFPWLKAEALAAQYHQPVDFVKRLLETCRLSGWPVEQAVKKHFQGDKSVVVPPEVQTIHREVVKQWYRR